VALFAEKGLVGLIGSSAVSRAESRRAGGASTSSSIGHRRRGAIMDSGAVIDAIQRLFSAQKIKTADVATSVSGNAVIVKKISLPQMSAEELAESIHWEAEQYIPFDIQDVAIDYEVIDGGGGGGNMDVLLVAVKKDKISDYTGVVSQAGKNPVILDVDVFALQNCYENYGWTRGA
jgi:type IV pilus assembly protein PilM